jgi:hypothetical protein
MFLQCAGSNQTAVATVQCEDQCQCDPNSDSCPCADQCDQQCDDACQQTLDQCDQQVGSNPQCSDGAAGGAAPGGF